MTPKMVTAIGLRFMAICLIGNAIFEFANMRLVDRLLNRPGVHRRDWSYDQSASAGTEIVSRNGGVPASTFVSAGWTMRAVIGLLVLVFAISLADLLIWRIEETGQSSSVNPNSAATETEAK